MMVYLRRSNARDLEVPRTYALAMVGGVSIGGTARDETGRPIKGLSVKIAEMNPADGARAVFDANAVAAATDALGRWHIDAIPASMNLAHLQLSFAHPDFLSVFESSRSQGNATPEQLRSRRAVTMTNAAYSGWTPPAVDHCPIGGIKTARSLNPTCFVLGQTLRPVDRSTASSFGTTPACKRPHSIATGPASIGQSTPQIHNSSESIRPPPRLPSRKTAHCRARARPTPGTSSGFRPSAGSPAAIGLTDTSSVYAMTGL